MKSFSRNIRFALALSCGLALSACDQTLKIENGVIPDEFIPHVQKFLGEYQGQIEHRATGLVASLDGNHLVLKSTDDIIAPACQSKIGNLTKLSYKEEKDKSVTITEALFDFNPNLCGHEVKGHELKFTTSNPNPFTLDLSFLDHYEWGWSCNGDFYRSPFPPATPYPGDHCYQQQYGVYQQGRFVHH